MRHEAIRALYNNVVTIDDTAGAFDKDGKAVSIDEDAVTAKANELTAANAYIGKRAAAYASIGDQLDMQYWDAVNGTTTWKDHVAKVKSDNAKPD
jgi:hypothetical protein